MSKESRKDNCIHFLGIQDEDQVVFLKDTASGGWIAKKRYTLKENLWDENEWSSDGSNQDVIVVDLETERKKREADSHKIDYVIYEVNPYINGGLQQLEEKITLVMKSLAPTGRLVLMMENPYSVHKLAGDTDRNGNLFQCFEKRPNECCGIGYKKLKEVLTKMFSSEKLTWYYPYPTLDFPVAIYSDTYLPKNGECVEKYYNFEKARLELFDETDAFDEVIKSDMFRELANCYMVVVGEPLPEKLKYCRYSNERAKGLRIRTDILEDKVRKVAYDKDSVSHILRLEYWEGKLNQQLTSMKYMGKKVVANHICQKEEDYVSFDFINGMSLEQHLDELILQGHVESAKTLILSFCKLLNVQPGLKAFEQTKEFEKVFGRLNEEKLNQLVQQSSPLYAAPVTNIDMICQNVLLSDQIYVIDYEWTFDFPIPVDYVIYRILFFYLEFQDRKAAFGDFDFYEALSITEEKKKMFAGMETAFQKYVQGDVTLLSDAYFAQGMPVLTIGHLKKQLEDLEQSQIELLLQTKDGLKKEYRSIREDEKGVISFALDFQPSDLIHLSILPGVTNAMMRICLLQEDEEGSKPISFSANGTAINSILYLFDDLACVEVSDILPETKRIYVSLEVVALPDTFVVEFKKSFSDLTEVVANREEQLTALQNSLSWKITEPLRKIKGH